MPLARTVAALRDAGCVAVASADPDRVSRLEALFGRRLPPLYRSLCAGYLFGPTDLDEVSLFGNDTPQGDDDISVAPFRDKIMSGWLLERGYIQFGRPATGTYDPVCFAVANRAGAEPSIVQLDHEAILLGRARVGHRVVAVTFAALVAVA